MSTTDGSTSADEDVIVPTPLQVNPHTSGLCIEHDKGQALYTHKHGHDKMYLWKSDFNSRKHDKFYQLALKSEPDVKWEAKNKDPIWRQF